MNTAFLILVAVAGIALGYLFGRRGGGGDTLLSKQARKKDEGKEKILAFLREHGEIRNNDVERELGVSDATATRYLDELEQGGTIRQVGKEGHAVYYVLK